MTIKKKQHHPITPFRISKKTKKRLTELKIGKGTWEYFFMILCNNHEIIDNMFKKK